MNAQELAQAVVHWLAFERLCGRESLFTEASLKSPVHQYLTAKEPFDVELEQELPGIPSAMKKQKGRKKSLDFCLRRPKRKETNGKGVLVDVMESKFVNTKRHFAQEVLNDLFRLRWLKPRNQTEPCDRWLLLAGLNSDVKAQVLQKGSTKRKPATETALYGVLHREQDKLWTVDVRNATKTHRARWATAGKQLLQKNVPSKFKTKLAAVFPAPQSTDDNDYICMIWRVIKPISKKRH